MLPDARLKGWTPGLGVLGRRDPFLQPRVVPSTSPPARPIIIRRPSDGREVHVQDLARTHRSPIPTTPNVLNETAMVRRSNTHMRYNADRFDFHAALPTVSAGKQGTGKRTRNRRIGAAAPFVQQSPAIAFNTGYKLTLSQSTAAPDIGSKLLAPLAVLSVLSTSAKVFDMNALLVEGEDVEPTSTGDSMSSTASTPELESSNGQSEYSPGQADLIHDKSSGSTPAIHDSEFLREVLECDRYFLRHLALLEEEAQRARRINLVQKAPTTSFAPSGRSTEGQDHLACASPEPISPIAAPQWPIVRYDREFLMQFMPIRGEKPKFFISPSELGLDPSISRKQSVPQRNPPSPSYALDKTPSWRSPGSHVVGACNMGRSQRRESTSVLTSNIFAQLSDGCEWEQDAHMKLWEESQHGPKTQVLLRQAFRSR